MAKGSQFTLHTKDASGREGSYCANTLTVCINKDNKLVVSFISSGYLTEVPVEDVVKIEVGGWTHCHNCDQPLGRAPFFHPVFSG
jgi:hypothetical protein